MTDLKKQLLKITPDFEDDLLDKLESFITERDKKLLGFYKKYFWTGTGYVLHSKPELSQIELSLSELLDKFNSK